MPTIMADSEQNILTCTRNIEKINMEIYQLQHIKYWLMGRKRQLVHETSKSERKMPIEDLDLDTKNIYDKVLPLVCEIHNLELRSLEVNEQLQLAEMDQEASALLASLAGKNCRKKGSLFYWFEELEQMNTAGSTLNNPRYQMWTQKSGIKKEKLEFTVFHCGVSVTIQIVLTGQPQEQEDCTLGDTSSQLVHVISDIFIPELQGTVKSSLQEKNSISVVVQTIVQYIAEEIVPYTGSYVTNETSENRKEESKSMPS